MVYAIAIAPVTIILGRITCKCRFGNPAFDIGAGFGKVQKFRIPVNFQIQAFYNAVKPDNGADWQLRVQIQPMIPMKP